MTIPCVNGCDAPAQRYVRYYREIAGGSRIYPRDNVGTGLVCAECVDAYSAGAETYERRLRANGAPSENGAVTHGVADTDGAQERPEIDAPAAFEEATNVSVADAIPELTTLSAVDAVPPPVAEAMPEPIGVAAVEAMPELTSMAAVGAMPGLTSASPVEAMPESTRIDDADALTETTSAARADAFVEPATGAFDGPALPSADRAEKQRVQLGLGALVATALTAMIVVAWRAARRRSRGT